MGETRHAFATRDVETGIPNKERSFQLFGKREVGDFDGSFPDGSASRSPQSSMAGIKAKDPHHQREAVIRPQQAGKIDFKSLQNRPKFPQDGPWGGPQGSPQSPTRKSRSREKNRRLGKGERAGHQQLYRLTITSTRPSPTIGIAYPQQKVTPPKKATQGGAVSGNYRYQVPEREAEQQQGDLSFTRCYPEASSSLLPSNYTSATGTPRLNPAAKLPSALSGVSHESPVPHGPLHYVENNGSHAWPSPEKSFPGATSSSSHSRSGLSKACPFPESGKAGPLCLGPLSFHCPFQPSGPFPGDEPAGEYMDLSMATGPGSHGAFAFHSSVRDWKEDPLTLGPCSGLGLESRACGLPPLPPAFLPPLQAQGPLLDYKGRKEAPSDHNGAISPPGAIDKNSSTFQDHPALFPAGVQGSSKRPPSLKDSVASPRVLDAGHTLRRTLPLPPLSQVHFQRKACHDPSAGGGSPGPALFLFEKSPRSATQLHARLRPVWDSGREPQAPAEEGTAASQSPLASPLSFGCPSGQEPCQPVKKPWPPSQVASQLPGQSRTELPRKLPFALGTSEWEGSGKLQKSPAVSRGIRAPLAGEGAIMPRQGEPGPSAFCFDRAKDVQPPTAGSPRGKGLFFGVAQGASAHLPPLPVLALSPSTLATSPSESPVPSPTLSGGSGACSSLSSTSSVSPSGGFEEGAVFCLPTGFHPLCHPKSSHKPSHASESLDAGEGPGPAADPAKALLLSQGVLKQEPSHRSQPADGPALKPCLEAPFKGCLLGLEAEPPPPPYSSHHFLASSLSTASLDQLDVFLTCKQCDQNFSTLPSFLAHRQFCSSHLGLQSQPKEAPHSSESRNQAPIPPAPPEKPTPGAPGLLLLPEPALQLAALSKDSDFLADEDGKGDSKAAPNPLPLMASDMEIDDAKLDSLITETLNGLGYQSDSPEIDSSFIDVFADDELASVKVAGSGMPCKLKEDLPLAVQTKQVDTEENVKVLSCYDSHPCHDTAQGGVPPQHHRLQERPTGWPPRHGEDSLETLRSTELPPSKRAESQMYGEEPREAGARAKGRWQDGSSPPLTTKQGARAALATRQPQSSPSLPTSKLGGPSRSTARKEDVKEATKKQRRSSTWSKELIHKIVQQKNKLHRVPTKGGKATPCPLLVDRLVPEMKDSKFGEYDYISESDEERVEYAKRHCRRKLGPRLSGRLRNSFGRRRPGRAGREKKEKEPTWRFGPRRALGEAFRRKEERLARAWRRSSRSSTSSCQSTSFSSETSNSSPGTEQADSDTEKESEGGRRRRLLPSSPTEAQALSREGRVMPKEEAAGSRPTESQPVGFTAPLKEQPSASPLPYPNREGAWLHREEEPPHHQGSLGSGPLAPVGPKESADWHGGTVGGTAALEADLSREGGHHPPRQLPAYQGESLKCQQDELLAFSPQGFPGEGHASGQQGQAKGWRKPMECLAAVDGFNGSPVVDGMVGKGLDAPADAAGMFSNSKGLSSHDEPSDLFSAPMEPPHSALFYLCQRDLVAGPFKERPRQTGPGGAKSEPPTASAPLGFDSSSVFGELPAAAFDATMYEEVGASKEEYIPFASPGHQLSKMGAFDQHYPAFLHDKAWDLDGGSGLPEDISSFHSLPEEKLETKSYPETLSPGTLPRQAAGCNLPFLSSTAADELEIKRLVTELEKQLQTGKLPMEEEEEPPSGHSAAPKLHTGQREPPREFLPLTLIQESPGKGLYLAKAQFETEDLLAANAYPCESLDQEKAAPGPKYRRHPDTWPGSAPFGPFRDALCPPSSSELILAAPLSSKGDQGKLYGSLKDMELSRDAGFPGMRGDPAGMVADPCLPGPSCPEHWMPGPGSQLLPTVEAAEPPAPNASPATPFLDLPPKGGEGEGAESAAGLRSFPHPLPCLRPAFEEGSAAAAATQERPGGNTAPSFPSPASPEEEEEEAFHESRSPDMLASATLLHSGPGAREKGSQASSQTPTAPGKGGERAAALTLEPLPYSEEGHGEAGPQSAPEEKAPNPLQQLQLFVARTAKHNEEDLLLPCFPVGLPAPHLHRTNDEHPRQEKETGGAMPGEEAGRHPGLEARRVSCIAEEPKGPSRASDPTEGLRELAEQGECPGGRPGARLEAPARAPSLERSHAVADGQQQHCRDWQLHRAEGRPKNIAAGGLSPEGNSSVATSSPRENKTPDGQIMGGLEEGTAALAFQREAKSPLSRGSQEEEMPGSAPVLCLGAWGNACPEGQGLWTEEAPQAERKGPLKGKQLPSLSLAPGPPPQGDHSLPQGTVLCLGTGPVSAEGNGPQKQQVGCPEEASPSALPQNVSLAEQEDMQDEDPGSGACSDLGLPPAEEGGGLLDAGGRQGLLRGCGQTPGAMRRAPGQATRTPSELQEQGGGKQLCPIWQHMGGPSPLRSEAPTGAQESLEKEMDEGHLASPEKKVPTPWAPVLCSGNLATCLAGTGQPTEAQANPSDVSLGATLSFENKDLPRLEELPKSPGDEDSALCRARAWVASPQSASRPNIPPSYSPSEVDSVLLTEERAATNAEFPRKNLARKENKSWSHPPIRTKVLGGDASVPPMPMANLTEPGNTGGTQPGHEGFPNVTEKGLGGALQDVDCGGPTLEDKNAVREQNSKGLPRGCLELGGSEEVGRRDAFKTRQPRAKRRRGLPSTCDVCFLPFKSKLGLRKHKAIKHLKTNVRPLLLDHDLSSPKEPSEPSKPLSRKTRKPSMDSQEPSSSRLAKATAGPPFPRASRGLRREPSREIQEVVSKVLSDLSAFSSTISHKRDGPHKETKAKPVSPWADCADEQLSTSPAEERAMGKGRGASAKELESFPGRKTKGKARKRKGKVATGHKEATGHPLQSQLASAHLDVTPNSLDSVLTTALERKEVSPTCTTEDLASDQTPPWPFGPLALKGSEGAPGRRPSKDQTPKPGPLRGAQGSREQAGERVGKGHWSTPDHWPKASREAMEEAGKNGACEEHRNGPALEGSSGERKAMDPENLLGSLAASHPLDEGPPESASDKALEPTRPHPVNAAEPWREEKHPPETDPHGVSAVADNLHSLFDDDDSSFSQLFPRNNRFDARRKCTRVYGKRPKKLRPVAEGKALPEGPADPLHVRTASDLGDIRSLRATKEDPWEYDTISIDGTPLIGNSCHSGSAGASEARSRSAVCMARPPETGPREEGPDSHHVSQLGLLEQKSLAGSLPGFSHQSSPERKAGGVSLGEALLSPHQEFRTMTGHSVAESSSTEDPDLGGGGAFESQADETLPSPAFDTIGREMLSAKFELRDLCLHGAGEDPRSQAGDDGSQGPPILPSTAVKSKLEEGKPGKTCSDPSSLKGKDKPYKCKVCFQWFVTLGELDFHKLSHNPSPPPTCYMCVQRRFSSREQLRDHLKEKHARNKAGLWACGMCLKEISDVWMYNEHLREHATQFARRGRAQASVLGLAGSGGSGFGGEDEAAVSRFLCSIMRQKPSKASRQMEAGSRVPTGQENRGQKEPLGLEGGLGKDSPEVLPATKPPAPSTKMASSPASALKPDSGAQRLAQAMHPECKDPSRDCHHCGKQFPKPFKLQRHLVVHSLQKIYLCPLCPRFYQETKELRHHLGQEHRVAEATELKHTTLYACELCADVMHVIKKSFICSACNYTFSKKEQYDRHMEKHRVGGSRTFRFRGVMRPRAAPGKEGSKKVKEEVPLGEGIPAAKRKKVAPQHGLSLACSDDSQGAPLEGEPSSPLGRPPPPATTRMHKAPSQDPVKSKELEGDTSSLLSEMPESPPGSLPPPTPQVPPEGESRAPGLDHRSVGQPSESGLLAGNLLPSLDPSGAGFGANLARVTAMKIASPASVAQKGPPTHPPKKHSKEPSAPGNKPLSGGSSNAAPALGTWVGLAFEDHPVNNMLGLARVSPEAMGGTDPPPEETQPPGGAAKQRCPEAALQVLPLKDKMPWPALLCPAGETPAKKSTGGQSQAELGLRGVAQDPPASCGTSVSSQEPGSHPLKPTGGAFRGEAGRGGGPAKASLAEPGRCPKRPVGSPLARARAPKRKGHTPSHKGSPASRENLQEEDGRKKKARSPDPAKNNGARRPPRTGWASGEGLASFLRRRDSPCPKLPLPGIPLRKLVPDPCLQKKGEGCLLAKGDWKPRRKGLLGGKAVHPLVAKDPSLATSSNRPRAAQGAKLSDSHHYRTAESQNNLLSQLFGQKLTSFKIPLRRDTSE